MKLIEKWNQKSVWQITGFEVTVLFFCAFKIDYVAIRNQALIIAWFTSFTSKQKANQCKIYIKNIINK